MEAKAISRDTVTELFRKSEVLPEGRTRGEGTKVDRAGPGGFTEGPKDAKKTELVNGN
jgi:hypothetical protein